MGMRPARATQADIARAVKALLQAGGQGCVEVASDGTIRVIPYREMLAPAQKPVEKRREIVL